MKTREQDTVRAILQLLALHKIPAWRLNSGAFRAEYRGRPRFHRFGVTGMSDVIGIVPKAMTEPLFGRGVARWTDAGRFLAIEVKSATGKVSPAQQAFLDQVNAAGGKAFVARTLDDVKRELSL